MQNKTAIWVFAILLTVACLYQLSFTWVAGSVESNAEVVAEEKLDSVIASVATPLGEYEIDSVRQKYESDYLLSMTEEQVYPILGHTYGYAKEREINQGLDLQGGMNVTLEVSLVDLINALAGDYKDNEDFQKAIQLALAKQQDSNENFVTLFGNAYKEVDPNIQLWSVFRSRENKDFVEIDTPNDVVLAKIQEEAKQAVSRTRQVISKRIDNLGVVQPKIQEIEGDRIMVELPGVRDKARIVKILQGTAKLEFWEMIPVVQVGPTFEQVSQMLVDQIDQEGGADDATEDDQTADVDSTATPVDTSNTAAAAAGDADSDETADEATPADSADADSALADPAADELAEDGPESPLYKIFQPNVQQTATGFQWAQGPIIGYVQVTDTADFNRLMARPEVKEMFSDDAGFRWGSKPFVTEEKISFMELYCIDLGRDGEPVLGGERISTARVSQDQMGNPTVNLIMDGDGASMWAKITEENVGKSVGIVLDDLVYSAPNINEKIASGSSEIAGGFTIQEAEDLVSVLKAGRLPARARIIESSLVGPSLGAEARKAGLISFLLALAIILGYMIFYYSRAGIVADIALVVNMFFIMGVLASLGATLTLPGIAGIVLTIGMSVDANVLIYERIREELSDGKGLRLAIMDGYKAAYSSIIDANITTLLTGIILSIFGSGPIKGFATTLIIGILTSLFSAIFITRLVFEWRLEKKKAIDFATRLTEGAFKNLNFAFVAKRKMYYLISGIVIVAGIASLGVRQLDWGTDFTGGRTYTVRFDQPADLEEIKASMNSTLVSGSDKAQSEVKTSGNSNQVRITTNYLIDNPNNVQEIDSVVDRHVYDAIAGHFAGGLTYDKYVLQDDNKQIGLMASSKVGSSIADDFRADAGWSVFFSLLVIFLYIVLRFRKWQFGLGALIAMIHDVMVVLAMFSIFYNVLPFAMEVDQAFIAAILTVVGYSINDTVVVFDRIREHLGLYKRKEMSEVVNGALNSTLSRTFNTSISTFFVLLMIFVFGGDAIKGFVFALMVGVVVGTYSSLCVATPIVLDFAKKETAVAKK